MRRRVRENALIASLGVLASVTMAWLGLYGFAWNDYEVEAQPSFEALVHGHLLLFLRDAPVYGGSLVERAPFALLPSLWGGGELALYRMVALPCLLAAAALAVWLVAEMRAQGRSRLARAIALGVCVANPLTLRALELGHPEDLFGGVLCVAAVLLALRGRPLWAGLVLGAAIANKEWALLAVGPVLLALPARRALCLAVAAAVTGVVLAPLALVGSGAFLASARGTAAPTSAIFQPWQVWWFLGHHGLAVHGLFGALKPGFRTAPGWVGRVSHPLIVVLSLPLAGLFWWRRRDEAPPATDALGLLALLLLLRCMLDTWDVSYYPLPFLFALLAWETVGAPLASTPLNRRLPLLAASCTALAWLSFQWLPAHAGPDAQSALFLAWTLPLAAALGVRLYAPRRVERLLERAGRTLGRGGALAAESPLRRSRSAPWAAR
jgi:Glycosyltransferase family 87